MPGATQRAIRTSSAPDRRATGLPRRRLHRHIVEGAVVASLVACRLARPKFAQNADRVAMLVLFDFILGSIRLENVSRNPLWLTAIAFMEPCRSAANVLRFKAPWYRDNRRVKAFEQREKIIASNPAH